jgi:hypothetical protein
MFIVNDCHTRTCGGFANKECRSDESDFSFPAVRTLKVHDHVYTRPGEDKVMLFFDDNTDVSILNAYELAAQELEIVMSNLKIGMLDMKHVDAATRAQFSYPPAPFLRVHSVPQESSMGRPRKVRDLPEVSSNPSTIEAFVKDYFKVEDAHLNTIVKEFMEVSFKGRG